MGKIDKKEINKSDFRGIDLVLTINQNDEIIKFNEECERITGYDENEVLNQEFFEVLIPDRYLENWKQIFYSSRKNKVIDDFKLPWITKHGHQVMISWSSFPVVNPNGNVGDIGLVGRIITFWDDSDETGTSEPEEDLNVKEYLQDFDRVLKDLDKKNLELEKKNRSLERKLNKLKKKKSITITSAEEVGGKDIYHVSDVWDDKKKKEEFEALVQQLDERERLLNKREADITNDKKSINERRNTFIKWREQLEMLETEIAARWKEVIREEKLLEERISAIQETSAGEIALSDVDCSDLIDKLEECAVVVQRGVLKQVNDSFAELLGYDVEEIKDKSLFDFILPEGLSGIEEYYFNRLNGENVSNFRTVFLTKDNEKISVEVNTKSTFIDGEKAEIAIFKKQEEMKTKNLKED